MTPTRRAVLLASGATLVAACTGGSPDPRPAVVDPDDALRAAAVERERALLAAYDALLAGSPDLAARLQPLRAEHEAHLTALLGPPPSAAPSGAAPATPPATAVRTLPALVAAERAAATAHAAATVGASPALAALLAQLAASEASHPVALA